jgi:hypothetical protein
LTYDPASCAAIGQLKKETFSFVDSIKVTRITLLDDPASCAAIGRLNKETFSLVDSIRVTRIKSV